MKKYLSAFALILTFSSFSQGWETLESLPVSAANRHHPITFSIGGIGYLVAGADASSRSLNDFYAYDPDADSWEIKGDYPGPKRGFGYGVASNTKGYVGFGLDYDPATGIETVLADLWEYDPVTDSWTELAPFPGTARYHPAMIYLNEKIYVGLGGSDFGDLSDWWEYDIASNVWTSRTEFPGTERHHPYYFSLGEYAYVGFGHHSSDIYNDFYRFDPATNSWTEMASFPGQGRVAGTQFSFDGNGYILSGQGETHTNLPTGEFWKYTPETDDWEAMPSHPNGGRWAPGSFFIDGGIYLTCGQANTGERRDLLRYQLEGVAAVTKNNSGEFQLAPNPTTGKVYLQSQDQQIINVKVFDTAGRYITSVQNINGQMDFSTVNKGVYILNVALENETLIEKLIVE